MSMSTYVAGFVPPDEVWARMKAVWDACEAAHIEPPDEVREFFGDEAPDPAGQTVDIPHREWNGGEMGAGFEVVLSEVPPNVKIIRFWNSW